MDEDKNQARPREDSLRHQISRARKAQGGEDNLLMAI